MRKRADVVRKLSLLRQALGAMRRGLRFNGTALAGFLAGVVPLAGIVAGLLTPARGVVAWFALFACAFVAMLLAKVEYREGDRLKAEADAIDV